jgi:hypothetical protein
MKYDFSTYLTQVLNENEKKKVNVFVTDDSAKTKTFNADIDQDSVEDWIDKNYKNIKLKNDNLIYTSPENNEEYTLKSKFDIKKMYNKIKDISGDKAKALDKDGFELLGKTIAYRSALTVWNIINNSGDDFKQAALDVFKDNSEYSIKQLENLDSLLDYSAAVGVVKDKKNRLEKDKNDANYESLLKKFNETEDKLATKENYTTIQLIKKDYEKEFNDKRDVYENAFNDGMAEQKKDMQAKDYKWKDPATGQPPKGKLAKSNQAADAIFKAIQSGVEKADDFAKRQQGLDKAILTLAVMGVKGMLFGGKMLKKLLTGFLKKTNIKDIMRYTAKFNDVKNKINVFKKEYDEWKKYNDAQQQKKEKTDDEKKEEEDRKKTISMKLSELMNTHVIPYYYCKMAIIVGCFENIEGKYIIKQENNKWSTYNSGSGRLTIIEDNAILMERILEVVNDQLVKKGVFETLKDESSTDAFKGIPKDLKYKKDYADKLLKWKDKIKSVSTVSKFNKDNLKNILNVYNDKVIVNGFASYEEFAKYVPIAQGSVKQHDIPVAKEIVIKFDGDEDAGVPGVITGAKKEDKKEEQNPEEDKEYQKILNSVEDIKNATNAEEVSKNYGDTKEKVDKAVDQIQNNIKDQEIKDYLDKHFLNIQKADTLTKMMYLNTAKSKGLFDSCVAFNYAMNMLLENDNSSGNSSEVFKDIVNLLNGESNDNTIEDFKKKDEELNTSMEKAKEQMKDDVKKALPDDPLAVYSYLNKKEKPKKLEVNVDTLIQQLERPDTDYEKLQKEYSSYDKMIKDYIGKDEDKLKQYTRGSKIIEEFGDDIIPKLWFAKKYSDWVTKPKESYDPFIDYSLLFLLEDDETNNKDNKAEEVKKKVKEAYNQLDDIIAADSLEPYKKWKAGIIELFKQFGDKIENKDELKDPVQMLSAMIDYMESNKPEEKKENPQPAEEGAKSEKSEEAEKS